MDNKYCEKFIAMNDKRKKLYRNSIDTKLFLFYSQNTKSPESEILFYDNDCFHSARYTKVHIVILWQT